MSAKMEYKGADVEEAIGNACASLNVGRDELSITVVSTGSAGIFGLGRKKAVVRVSLRRESPVAEESAVQAPEPAKQRPAKSRREQEPRRAEQAAKQADAPEAKAAAKPARSEEGEAEEREDLVGDPVSAEEVEAIRADLARLVELMGCPAEVAMEVDQNNKVHARISGDSVEMLIGQEGQTLDSIQYLMRKVITRKFPQKVLFAVDAGGFRANRGEELRERALRLAQEVKESGKSRTIPAINPSERRIVHMALQDDPDIRSRSIGEGLFKKVLIYPPGKGRKRPARRKKGERQEKG
ncbi:MAG: RNA-binding cell elongation regulator Jag/EloR [Thermodesulfobacteriota bacterium]